MFLYFSQIRICIPLLYFSKGEELLRFYSVETRFPTTITITILIYSFNSRNALLLCVLGNAILTLIVPIVAPVLWLLYVTRFVMGVVSAPNLPIVAIMVGRWVVYEEKSLWFGIIYSGTSIGTVISILTSGMILHALGWEAVFYIHGALSLIWCVVFLIFFRESPETQYYISEEERHYIVTSYGHRGLESVHMKVPWKAIFTSVPFLALIYTNTFGNFAWYFLLTQLPMYMNKILRFDIQSVSLKFLSSSRAFHSSFRASFFKNDEIVIPFSLIKLFRSLQFLNVIDEDCTN